MKPYRIAALFACSLIVCAMTGCVTETTTITHPDGRVETIKKTYPAPGAVEAAATVAAEVIDEK